MKVSTERISMYLHRFVWRGSYTPWYTIISTKCTDDDNSHYHWFQFTYTSMFGKLSEVIYSATDQNLWSCIVLHMICNIFGLPNFSLNSPRVTHQVVFYSLIVLGIVHSLIVLLYYM